MRDHAAVLPLASLVRKAAVDAGFDLEPERDGSWWRLRAGGAPGVAWVRMVPAIAGSPTMGNASLLALPLAAQLAELGLPAAGSPESLGDGLLGLPVGAAGAVSCPSPEVLHGALRRVWTLRAHAPEKMRARSEGEVTSALAGALTTAGSPAAVRIDAPLVTEAIAEVRRRVGQELFRDALLDYWEGRCAVTGLAVPELLRASHAKPWSAATDAERLDVHNGLLLAVHLDALFDRGLLTFDDEGRGVVSSQLPASALGLLGLSEVPLNLRRVQQAHRPYLAHHRTHVFRP